MTARPRVFVSGARDDLESYRELLDVLLSETGCVAVWHDPLHQESDTVRKLTKDTISSCDAVLHLVGRCFGAHPNDQLLDKDPRSYSQREYDIARELKRPLAVLLCADDFPYDDRRPEVEGLRILQQGHRSAVASSDEALCLTIKDKQELASRVRDLCIELQAYLEIGGSIFPPESEGKDPKTPSESSEDVGVSIREEAPRRRLGGPPEPPVREVQTSVENIQFTAYRPKVIQPSKWTKMLVFAHLDERPDWLDQDERDPIEEMAAQAAQILGLTIEDYRHTTEDSGSPIPQEGEITFVPTVPGIEFNPTRRSFLWKDGVSLHYETFDLRGSNEIEGQTVRGVLIIFSGHLILAEINISIRVSKQVDQLGPAARERSSAQSFRRIFASYSHRDAEIVEATERHARALGDEYLLDWMHLRSGEIWSDRLREMVSGADIFQLFWSRNSANSKFVEQEWRFALGLNRPWFVRPIYWQDPMPSPPEELRSIHFHRLVGSNSFDSAKSLSAAMPKVAETSTPESPQVAAEVLRSQPLFMPSTSSRSFMPSTGPKRNVLPPVSRTLRQHSRSRSKLRTAPMGRILLALLVLLALIVFIVLIRK